MPSLPTHITINITGLARNIDGKPAVVADKIGIYFIANMHQWQDAWLNRRIKIIGDLEKKAMNLIKQPVVQLL